MQSEKYDVSSRWHVEEYDPEKDGAPEHYEELGPEKSCDGEGDN